MKTIVLPSNVRRSASSPSRHSNGDSSSAVTRFAESFATDTALECRKTVGLRASCATVATNVQ
jgi:hypothetical protein